MQSLPRAAPPRTVVAELVLAEQALAAGKLRKHLRPVGGVAVAQARLHHVAGELVAAQLHSLTRQRGKQPLALSRRAVLQHVLAHVVAVLAARQLRSRGQHILDDAHGVTLLRAAVLQHALHHPAAVRVLRQTQPAAAQGRHDARALRGGALDAALDD